MKTWIGNDKKKNYIDVIKNDKIKLSITPYMTRIINEEGSEIDYRKIKYNTDIKVKCILLLQNIWFTDDNYSLNIKVSELKIFNKMDKPSVCCKCDGVTSFIPPPPPLPPPDFKITIVEKEKEIVKPIKKIFKAEKELAFINEIKLGNFKLKEIPKDNINKKNNDKLESIKLIINNLKHVDRIIFPSEDSSD